MVRDQKHKVKALWSLFFFPRGTDDNAAMHIHQGTFFQMEGMLSLPILYVVKHGKCHKLHAIGIKLSFSVKYQ